MRELALTANAAFGIVSVLTAGGIHVLGSWLERNPALQLRLILTVYPTCGTRRSDLARLQEIVECWRERMAVHVRPLGQIADRATTILCFLGPTSDTVHVAAGAFEDLGLSEGGGPNLLFRADPPLVEAFKRHFD